MHRAIKTTLKKRYCGPKKTHKKIKTLKHQTRLKLRLQIWALTRK